MGMKELGVATKPWGWQPGGMGKKAVDYCWGLPWGEDQTPALPWCPLWPSQRGSTSMPESSGPVGRENQARKATGHLMQASGTSQAESLGHAEQVDNGAARRAGQEAGTWLEAGQGPAWWSQAP